RPLAVRRLVDPHAAPLAGLLTLVVAHADDQLLVAVAVEVGAPDRVAPLQPIVDNVAVPQLLRRVVRRRVDDHLVAVAWLDGGNVLAALREVAEFDLAGAAVAPGVVLVAGAQLRLRPLPAQPAQHVDAFVAGREDVLSPPRR